MEETGCEIICGAPMTLAIKGLMMMNIEVDYDTAHSFIITLLVLKY